MKWSCFVVLYVPALGFMSPGSESACARIGERSARGFGGQELGFEVLGCGVWGIGCRVLGAGCDVRGVKCRVWGAGCRDSGL